ncbi:unnamed protein product [Bursaphelenchus okinawaensis]|uniref:Uncharacterized protein n=1 Tax=Bursaphelenchus okinawaensis TaxID=465554 RepID=A0A811L8I9_9BILA|nr:unnamed protein product [Bursaphelenchus okinawaensis]CAG9119867.1 unnamed protein product [Bursaphelenchus okinawaensis]
MKAAVVLTLLFIVESCAPSELTWDGIGNWLRKNPDLEVKIEIVADNVNSEGYPSPLPPRQDSQTVTVSAITIDQNQTNLEAMVSSQPAETNDTQIVSAELPVESPDTNATTASELDEKIENALGLKFSKLEEKIEALLLTSKNETDKGEDNIKVYIESLKTDLTSEFTAKLDKITETIAKIQEALKKPAPPTKLSPPAKPATPPKKQTESLPKKVENSKKQ